MWVNRDWLVASTDCCAWPCFSISASFLCFSNFIIVCHAQLDVKPSYLLKLFQCKCISTAPITKRTMCLVALLNLYVLSKEISCPISKAKSNKLLTPPTNPYWIISVHKPQPGTAIYSGLCGCQVISRPW